MSDGSDDVLKPARDEAFRKLGRNIALFQQLEARLKVLIACSELSGSTAEELKAFQEKRRASIQKRGLGQLIGIYCDEVVGPEADDTPDEAPVSTVRITTRFRVEGPEYLEQKSKSLGELVGRRNRLVHCLIDDFDLFSADGIAALDASLDPLADEVRTEIVELNELLGALQSLGQQTAAVLASPEGVEAIERGFLQSSRLITMAVEIYARIARPDGWAVLSKAAAIVHKEAPEELAELKPRYGHTSLKRALLASDYFDIAEEQTARGGVRVLFRARQAV